MRPCGKLLLAQRWRNPVSVPFFLRETYRGVEIAAVIHDRARFAVHYKTGYCISRHYPSMREAINEAKKYIDKEYANGWEWHFDQMLKDIPILNA